ADAHAARQLETRRASGLQQGDTILLHPQRYRPRTEAGRFLLAHEAVHVAQRRARLPAGRAAAGDGARLLPPGFVSGRRVERPLVALPVAEIALFEGPDPDQAFADLLRDNHDDELDRIRDSLSYGVFDWAITDGDVADVLRIMEPLPFPTQVALVGTLKVPFPERFASNISPVHFKRYRTSILAAYDAITQQNPSYLQDNPFDGMDFSAIVPAEHDALRRILPAFTGTARGRAWLARQPKQMLARLDDILN